MRGPVGSRMGALLVLSLVVWTCANTADETRETTSTTATPTAIAASSTTTALATTTTTATTTTSTTVPQLPSYEDVLASYPEGVVLCDSEAELNGQNPDGMLDVTIRAGTLLIGDELQFPCWGMRFYVLEDATLDGVLYAAGTVLVVGPDADPSYLSSALPPSGVSTMLAQPANGTWDYTGGMDWVQIDE